MEVEALLECTHIVFIAIDNAVLLPMLGDKVVCKRCNRERKIILVGIPYPQPDKENTAQEREEP